MGSICAPVTEGNPQTWLVIWTMNNILVTLLNKAAFSTVDFRYPFLLSAIHMLCNLIGSQVYIRVAGSDFDNVSDKSVKTVTVISAGSNNVFGRVSRRVLDRKGKLMIFLFSFIFSMNIAIGNVSLRHVSVNFNQVMRSLVPALTIFMETAMGKTISTRRKLAVIPIICGVAMACYGDMSYTPLGFFITCLCVLFAALKVVASGQMLTGSLKLHPVDLLSYMAPLAMFECIIMSFVTGEISSVTPRLSTDLHPSVDIRPIAICFGSGILAFSLNICSLIANKLTSPLTLCIAANVKQVIMIAVSTLIFNIEISFMNGLGIVVVLLGSARYSYVSVVEKTSSKKDVSENNDLEKGAEVKKKSSAQIGSGPISRPSAEVKKNLSAQIGSGPTSRAKSMMASSR